jgi:hypothetical protein
MAWTVEPPWDWALAVGALLLLSVFVFGTSWIAYRDGYRPPQAGRMALFRALRWLLLFGGAFVLLFWLASLVRLPGWWRYLVGGGLWWLLGRTVLAAAWEMLDERFG